MIRRFLFPVCLLGLVSFLVALELPGEYRSLPFGADTLQLRRLFPETEMHRFTLSTIPSLSDTERSVYRLIFKKGMVDSAWLYFVESRFAMAVEFYYPGEEYARKSLAQLTSRYGQFVGSGTTFFKPDGGRRVMTGYRAASKIATVTWMDEALAAPLRTVLPEGDGPASIDRELRRLQDRLDSLDKP